MCSDGVRDVFCWPGERMSTSQPGVSSGGGQTLCPHHNTPFAGSSLI